MTVEDFMDNTLKNIKDLSDSEIEEMCVIIDQSQTIFSYNGYATELKRRRRDNKINEILK